MTQTPTDPSKLSESEFLRLEAEKAKLGITESLKRAQAALTDNVDPRSLTRKHPWIALASAAVAGFAAASVVIPSKAEQELRKAERLHRAMHPPAPVPVGNGYAKPVEEPSLGKTILKEVIQIVRTVLMTAISASIKAGANPQPPTDSGESMASTGAGPNNVSP